ncbi:biliverdin reductase A-like [Pecten maximus]|uniref:biliverdin reductase A-like n=1 Tax=Pecten maximus TaxID=6579 RepID=UPI0014587DAC|nr:biliverdin reductase A-like [Pecten maximus]XP_033740511.1 biliverdin reductase A-like [Pecten maximus]
MADGSTSNPYGVVVVGIGIAGRVRIRDLSVISHFRDCHWTIKGFVSRRDIEIKGVVKLDLDDAMSRQDVQVIIICTENEQHEDLVRKSLQHGKHVLVEFPVALSVASAKEFYQLASEKGLILHQENIALMNDFKDKLIGARKWNSGTISLTGKRNGWIGDMERSGQPFIANISLIETVYHLVGEVKVVGGKFTILENGYNATAELETVDGRKITVSLTRLTEAKRQKKVYFELEDGSVLEYVPEAPKSQPSQGEGTKPVIGLFMRDFLLFINEVKSSKNSEVDINRTIRSMEIAEDIHSLIL